MHIHSTGSYLQILRRKWAPSLTLEKKNHHSLPIQGESGPEIHQSGKSNIFDKMDYFKKVRDENGTETNLSEVIEATVEEGGEMITYNLRHIPIFFPLTIFIPGLGRRVLFGQAAEISFASVLAFHDFNQNLSLVVPSVGEETKNCPNLKFTTSMFDTEFSPRISSQRVAEILDLIPRRRQQEDSRKKKNNDNDDTRISYPTAIIGPALSSIAASMGILTGVKSVPLISGAATSGTLNNKGVYPTFGRVIPADQGSARGIVSFLSEVLNVTHLGVLFRKDEYGSDYARAIKFEASLLDPPMVVAFSPFDPDNSDEIEISRAIRFLQNSGFRYFFGATLLFQEYVDVMTQASKHNITGPGYYWMFGETMNGLHSATFPLDSPIINASFGSAFISPASPWDIEDGSSRYNEFISHWTNALNHNKTEDYVYSLLPDEVRDLLPTISTYNGGNKGLAALLYEAGMAVAIAACRSHSKHGPNFSGQQLFEQFLNVSFNGTMGQVLIDPKTGTRDPRTMAYSISSITPVMTEDGKSVKLRTARTYINEKLEDIDKPLSRTWKKLENATVLFSDNTTTAPPSLPPSFVETIPISDWAQNVGFTLSAIVLVMSMFFMIWTAAHRNTKVVKAAQPIFLHMLCVGTFIIGLAIVPLTLQDPSYEDSFLDFICMATPWLVSGGFVIAFSAILSKLKRVNALFGAGSHTRLVVESRDVMRPFTFLFVTNVTVLTTWTVLDPLTFNMNHTDASDQFGRPIEVYGRCINYELSAEYLAFTILWAAIILAVVLWANVEAYRARRIATEYSESQHLAVSMTLILQAILICLPLLFVVDALPTFWYLVEISILFIVSISMLLPIFLPKIHYLKKWCEEQTRRESRKSVRIQKWAEMKERIDESNEQTLTSGTERLSRRMS